MRWFAVVSVLVSALAEFGDRQDVPKIIKDARNDDIPIFIKEGQVNTIDDKSVHRGSLRAVRTPCVSSIEELLLHCNQFLSFSMNGIDLLQIDIECFDYLVIYALGRLRPRFIHYEDTCLGNHSSRVKALLHKKGYLTTKGAGEDTLACLIGPCTDFDTVMTGLRGTINFIQVGANDGITNDPLRPYIAEGDFQGIMVEPTVGMYAKLSRLYGNDPKKCLYRAAFAPRGKCVDGTITFYKY